MKIRCWKLNRVYWVSVIFLLILIQYPVSGQSSMGFSIFEENGFKGLADSDGNKLIPAKYFNIGWTQGLPDFNNNVIGYEENGKWGLITSRNKIITPPKFINLYPSSNDNLIVASREGRFKGEIFFGIINTSGKEIISLKYAGIEINGNVAIAKYLEGNRVRYGLIRLDNLPVLPFEYDKITPLTPNLFALHKPSGKIALVNSKGKEIVRYELDSISSASGNTFRIFNQGKEGLLDSEGNLLLEPAYKKIEIASDGSTLSVLHFNNWQILSTDRNVMLEMLADNITPLGDDIFKITRNNRSWLVDINMEPISSVYDKIIELQDNYYEVKTRNKTGIINALGQEILTPDFDSLVMSGPFIYALNRQENQRKWMVFDTLGIQKSRYSYEDLMAVSERLIAVKRNKNWGFINREGEEIIQCVYTEVTRFEGGKSKVSFHGEEGVINRRGEWLVYPGPRKISIINDSLYLEKSKKQTRLLKFNGELVYFTDNDLSPKESFLIERVDSLTNWIISFYGTIINSDANLQIPPVRFYDSLNIIHRRDQVGVVSDSGLEVIPFGQYDQILPPSEGLLGIEVDGFYGFVDLNNKLRIANRYEGIGPFIAGLAAVKIRGRWGFINKSEELVCQPLYEDVGDFQNGICLVRNGQKWIVIDRNGKKVQSAEFEGIEKLESGNFRVLSNNSYGLLTPSGKTLLQTRYQGIDDLGDDRIMVKRRGHYGILDTNGVNLIPTIYDKLEYLPSKDQFLTMNKGVWETLSFSLTSIIK